MMRNKKAASSGRLSGTVDRIKRLSRSVARVKIRGQTHLLDHIAEIVDDGG